MNERGWLTAWRVNAYPAAVAINRRAYGWEKITPLMLNRAIAPYVDARQMPSIYCARVSEICATLRGAVPCRDAHGHSAPLLRQFHQPRHQIRVIHARRPP